MKIADKIKALTVFANKAQISRLLKLNPGSFSVMVYNGSVPSSTIALKLSKILGVSAEWLMDDNDSTWPPVRVERSLPGEPLEIDPSKLTPKLRQLIAAIDAASQAPSPINTDKPADKKGSCVADAGNSGRSARHETGASRAKSTNAA
jgi:hypothetical protein